MIDFVQGSEEQVAASPPSGGGGMSVIEAITAVMRSVPVVEKKDRNTVQNFTFRGIDAVLSAVGPKLREHGVVVTPQVMEHHCEVAEFGKNKTPMQSVVLLVRYTFYGPGGDSIQVEVPGQAADSGDKAYSKAMSVAFRTALIQTLALPTDEKDPDEETYERATPGPPPPATKSEADIARDELLAKVRRIGLNPGDVAQLYYAENNVRLQEDIGVDRIRSFADRLEPAK